MKRTIFVTITLNDRDENGAQTGRNWAGQHFADALNDAGQSISALGGLDRVKLPVSGTLMDDDGEDIGSWAMVRA